MSDHETIVSRMANVPLEPELGDDGHFYWPMTGRPKSREQAWRDYWAVMRQGLPELALAGVLPEWIVDPDCSEAMRSAADEAQGRRAALELWVTKLIRGDAVELQVFPNLQQRVFDDPDDLRYARRRARRDGLPGVVATVADRYQLRLENI